MRKIKDCKKYLLDCKNKKDIRSAYMFIETFELLIKEKDKWKAIAVELDKETKCLVVSTIMFSDMYRRCLITNSDRYIYDNIGFMFSEEDLKERIRVFKIIRKIFRNNKMKYIEHIESILNIKTSIKTSELLVMSIVSHLDRILQCKSNIIEEFDWLANCVCDFSLYCCEKIDKYKDILNMGMAYGFYMNKGILYSEYVLTS